MMPTHPEDHLPGQTTAATIELVVAWNDEDTLNQVVLRSSCLGDVQVSLQDNRLANEPLPTLYNRHKHGSTADWLVFCHQDVVFRGEWVQRIRSCPPDACYGPIGIARDGRYLGRVQQTDGTYVGTPSWFSEVDGLDELCLVVPRRVYAQVDFDERFAFHFYAHDFCVQARGLGFPSRVVELDCQHKSRTLTGDVTSADYRRTKQIYIEKHADVVPLCTTTFQNYPKYWGHVETNQTLRAELAFIPDGSEVLEVGAGPGFVTQALLQRRCKVTCIEVDADSARSLRRLDVTVINGDVESLDFGRELGSSSFDVVIMGDVLEHLQKPELVLRRLEPFVKPGGFLVVSMPHMAHAAVRLHLLEGRFDYARTGLLDATHVRIYTLRAIIRLFGAAGWGISDLQRIRLGIFATEVPVDVLSPPVRLLRTLCADPEATVYQYVFRAFPNMPSPIESALADQRWDGTQARREVALAYELRGRRLFLSSEPDFRRGSRMFWRAFLLHRDVKWLVYALAGYLLPTSLLSWARSKVVARLEAESAAAPGPGHVPPTPS